MIGNLHFLQLYVDSYILQSLILVSGTVFGVLIGPYAGKLIDRESHKSILLAVGLIRMLAVVFMLIAVQFGSTFLVVLYSLAIGLSGAFYFPTFVILMSSASTLILGVIGALAFTRLRNIDSKRSLDMS